MAAGSFMLSNMCFRKYDLRLRNMKVPFGKSFDLIFQICHLLIIFAAVRVKRYYEPLSFVHGQKYATMNYNIVLYLLAMGY